MSLLEIEGLRIGYGETMAVDDISLSIERGESLGLVLTARSIARRARQLIRQNLAWAVLYNASVMPLAVSGTLKPWMAALGMSLSSLLVVANASRLVRERSRKDVADPLSAAEVSAS